MSQGQRGRPIFSAKAILVLAVIAFVLAAAYFPDVVTLATRNVLNVGAAVIRPFMREVVMVIIAIIGILVIMRAFPKKKK